MIDRLKSRCDLEVDGGIDPDTAQLAVEAGANVLVAGIGRIWNRGSRRRKWASLRASLASSVY
jgi:ribulose-phosphate 3-epimerase